MSSEFSLRAAGSERDRPEMNLRGVALLICVCACGASASLVTLVPAAKKIKPSKAWGPSVTPTHGEVWPRPRSVVDFHNHGYMALRTNAFTFNVS